MSEQIKGVPLDKLPAPEGMSWDATSERFIFKQVLEPLFEGDVSDSTEYGIALETGVKRAQAICDSFKNPADLKAAFIGKKKEVVTADGGTWDAAAEEEASVDFEKSLAKDTETVARISDEALFITMAVNRRSDAYDRLNGRELQFVNYTNRFAVATEILRRSQAGEFAKYHK